MNQAPRGTGRPVAMALALTIGAASHGFGPPPGQVTQLGQWDGFGGSYGDVWGDGNFAYIGHFGGSAVNIVDISNPASPVAITYPLPPPNTDCPPPPPPPPPVETFCTLICGAPCA